MHSISQRKLTISITKSYMYEYIYMALWWEWIIGGSFLAPHQIENCEEFKRPIEMDFEWLKGRLPTSICSYRLNASLWGTPWEA